MLRKTTLGPLLARLLLASVVSTGMSGCLIGSHKTEASSGKQVSSATFNQIQPGTTTAEWIQATLGEPTSKSTLADGTQVWKWAYSKVETSRGSLLFVFGGSSTKATGGAAYVEIRDGLVTRAWRTDG